MQTKTIQMFVSYSHQDSLWLQEGHHGLIPWLAHAPRGTTCKSGTIMR
jgi:hypothetical protein